MVNDRQGARPAFRDEAERLLAEYLRDHPDFFNRHLDLLETLRIPHPCRPAVSLIERQLLLLREQNALLRSKLQELVAVARDNDCLSKRMQCLILELIEARGLDEMLHGIQGVLRDDFSADFTAVRLGAKPLEIALIEEKDLLAPEDFALFEPILRSGRPLCGRLTTEQAQYLFHEAASQVASAALVPLRGTDWIGLLAVGSCDEGRFHPAMGTLFLSRMGELISHALQPYLRSVPGSNGA